MGLKVDNGFIYGIKSSQRFPFPFVEKNMQFESRDSQNIEQTNLMKSVKLTGLWFEIG